MPTYEFKCVNCELEWEDLLLSYKDENPGCPNCNGSSKRLISLPAPGKVELTGFELKQQVINQAAKDVKEMSFNENKAANLIGESKFQQRTANAEKLAKETSKKVRRVG